MTRSSFRFAVSFVLMLWIAVPVRGATRTWGGNSIFGGSNWSSSENWFDNAPPTNSLTADIAVFRRWEFGPSRIDPTIDSPRSVRGVHVNSGTGVGGIPIFTFGGSNLTLGDVGIDVASNSGSGHVVNNNLILGADQIWTINTSLFVNGSVSGSGFFQKGGTGTLRLAGTGSWTSGGFTIRGGTVQVAGGNAIPNSAQVIFFQDGDVPRQLNLLAHETIHQRTRKFGRRHASHRPAEWQQFDDQRQRRFQQRHDYRLRPLGQKWKSRTRNQHGQQLERWHHHLQWRDRDHQSCRLGAGFRKRHRQWHGKADWIRQRERRRRNIRQRYGRRRPDARAIGYAGRNCGIQLAWQPHRHHGGRERE
jgi:autotransporter-associated beta strand protein